MSARTSKSAAKVVKLPVKAVVGAKASGGDDSLAKAFEWAKKTLGHTFKKKALLQEALTHGSSGLKPDYERLEFLGDRVLGLAVAELLMEHFGDVDEGELGRRHAALVKGETLVNVAHAWNVQPYIRVGAGDKGELWVGRSVLGDVVEGLFGAVYVDAGWKPARDLVRRTMIPLLATNDGRDAKTRLQEWLQSRKMTLPTYAVVQESGPDHAKIFLVRVACTAGVAEASASSKHEAGKRAAAVLLEKLEAPAKPTAAKPVKAKAKAPAKTTVKAAAKVAKKDKTHG